MVSNYRLVWYDNKQTALNRIVFRNKTINGIRIWKYGKYRKLDKDKQKCVEVFLRLGILIPIQNVPGGREITVKGNKWEYK